MSNRIDTAVKLVVAMFWIMFDIIVLVAKFVACIGLVVAYLLLAFFLAFVLVWLMELKVR